MKKIIILLQALFIYTSANSQGKIFKTYDDYLSNTGVETDNDYFNTIESNLGKVKVIFKKPNGKKVNYQPKEIWGFIYKDHIFRSTGRQFGMLEDTGKVYYYINGIAALWILGRQDSVGYYMVTGSAYFLSVGGLNGKVYGMQAINGFQKDFPAIKIEHPELKPLFDCVKGKSYKAARICVQEYNSSQ